MLSAATVAGLNLTRLDTLSSFSNDSGCVPLSIACKLCGRYGRAFRFLRAPTGTSNPSSIFFWCFIARDDIERGNKAGFFVLKFENGVLQAEGKETQNRDVEINNAFKVACLTIRVEYGPIHVTKRAMDRIAADIESYCGSKADARRALAVLTARAANGLILRGRINGKNVATAAREAPNDGKRKRKQPSADESPAKRTKLQEEPANDVFVNGHVIPASMADAFVAKVEDLMEVDSGLQETTIQLVNSWTRPLALPTPESSKKILDDDVYATEALVLCTALAEEASPVPMAVYVLGGNQIPHAWQNQLGIDAFTYISVDKVNKWVQNCRKAWADIPDSGADTAFAKKCETIAVYIQQSIRPGDSWDLYTTFKLGSVAASQVSQVSPSVRDFVLEFQRLLQSAVTTQGFLGESAYAPIREAMHSCKMELLRFWNTCDVRPVDMYTEAVTMKRHLGLLENDKLVASGSIVHFLATRFTFESYSVLSDTPPLAYQRMYQILLSNRNRVALERFVPWRQKFRSFNDALLPENVSHLESMARAPASVVEYANASLLFIMAACLVLNSSDNVFTDERFARLLNNAARLELSHSTLKAKEINDLEFFDGSNRENYDPEFRAYALVYDVQDEDVPRQRMQTTDDNDEDSSEHESEYEEYVMQECEDLQGAIEYEWSTELRRPFAGPMGDKDYLPKLYANSYRLKGLNFANAIGLATLAAYASYFNILYSVGNTEDVWYNDILIEFNEQVLAKPDVALFWKRVINNAWHERPFTFLVTTFLTVFPKTTPTYKKHLVPVYDSTGVRIGDSKLNTAVVDLGLRGIAGLKAKFVCNTQNFAANFGAAFAELLYAKETIDMMLRVSRKIDPALNVLFDIGYTFTDAQTKGYLVSEQEPRSYGVRRIPMKKEIFRHYLLTWADHNVHSVVPEARRRIEANLFFEKLKTLEPPETAWPDSLLPDALLYVGTRPEIELPIVPLPTGLRGEEISLEYLADLVKSTFSPYFEIESIESKTISDFGPKNNLSVTVTGSVNFTIVTGELADAVTCSLSWDDKTDVSSYERFLGRFEILYSKLNVSVYQLKTTNALNPDGGAIEKLTTIAHALLRAWFVPLRLDPERVLARTAAVIDNYDFTQTPPVFLNVAKSNVTGANAIASYWAGKMQSQTVTFAGCHDIVYEGLIQRHHNDEILRWLMVAQMLPSFDSFNHKTDMTYLVPRAGVVPRDAVDRTKEGSYVLREDPAVEFLPVARYALRSGETAYNEAIDPEFLRGTYYYYEPFSSFFLNTQMTPEAPRYLCKVSLAYNILANDDAAERALDFGSRIELQKILDLLEDAECPVEVTPFDDSYGTAWECLLSGQDVNFFPEKIEPVEGVPFEEAGQYTKGRKTTINLSQIAKTPQYFTKMLSQMVTYGSYLDAVIYDFLKYNKINVAVFKMEPRFNGLGTEILDTRSRIASYDAIVSIGV